MGIGGEYEAAEVGPCEHGPLSDEPVFPAVFGWAEPAERLRFDVGEPDDEGL